MPVLSVLALLALPPGLLVPDYEHALGRHAEAVAPLRRAIALEPSSFYRRARLGELYRLLGRFAEARAAYAEARARAPETAHEYYRLGYSRMEEGRPDNAVARHHLGMALWRAGRRPEACAEFDRAAELLESAGRGGATIGATARRAASSASPRKDALGRRRRARTISTPAAASTACGRCLRGSTRC